MNQKREAYAALYPAYERIDGVLESLEPLFVESDAEFRQDSFSSDNDEILTTRNILFALSGLPVTKALIDLYEVFLANPQISTYTRSDICEILGALYLNTPIELIEDLEKAVLKAVDKPGFDSFHLHPWSYQYPGVYYESFFNAKVRLLHYTHKYMGIPLDLNFIKEGLLKKAVDVAGLESPEVIFELSCESFLFSPDEMMQFLDNLNRYREYGLDYVVREELAKSMFCVLLENALVTQDSAMQD